MGRWDWGRRLRRESGATGTEYLLVISVLTTATVGGAFAFVPSFRDGVDGLGRNVSRTLATGKVPESPGWESEPGESEPGGVSADGGTAPPAAPSYDRECESSALGTECTSTEDVAQTGNGADDGCWGYSLAFFSEHSAEEVMEICGDLVETAMTVTQYTGELADGAQGSYATEVQTRYMSQESVGVCAQRLGVKTDMTTLEECLARGTGSQAMVLFDYDPETNTASPTADGTKGHYAVCIHPRNSAGDETEDFACFDSVTEEIIDVSDEAMQAALHETPTICVTEALPPTPDFASRGPY